MRSDVGIPAITKRTQIGTVKSFETMSNVMLHVFDILIHLLQVLLVSES